MGRLTACALSENKATATLRSHSDGTGAPGLQAEASCGRCPVRKVAFCSECSAEVMADIEPARRHRRFAPGETVMMEGADSRFAASVTSGMASLSRSLSDGRVQMVGLLFPGDIIGSQRTELSPVTVTALSPLSLCVIERRFFDRLSRDRAEVARKLLQMKLSELEEARDWMLLLGRKTARERVSSLICHTLRRTHPGGACAGTMMEIEVPLTRTAMADLLGLSMETVSRQMTQLRTEGVITYDSARRIQVHDPRALMEATGDDADGGLIS